MPGPAADSSAIAAFSSAAFRPPTRLRADNRSGFYIGETPVPFSDPNLFDINRIEVLRGPQGTLYGVELAGWDRQDRSQSVPTRSAFSSKVDSTLSTTKGGGTNYEVRGMANIPVIEDKVAIRATVASRHDEGFIDNAGPSLSVCDSRSSVPEWRAR